MQCLITLALLLTQTVSTQITNMQSIFGNAYILPEVVATAKRTPINTDAIFGNAYVFPEVVVTAKRETSDQNLAYRELRPVMGIAYRHIVHTINPSLLLFEISPKLAFANRMEKDDIDEDNDSVGVKIDISHMANTFGSNFYVDTNETINHDVSISGGTAVVDGEIDGSLAVMGGEAIINGRVTGEVAVFGGNLRIKGAVEDDAAVFGGEVKHQGVLESDLAVIGGSVKLDSGSVIKGNIVLIGGTIDQDSNAVIEGEVKTLKMPLSKLMPRISKLFRLSPQLDIVSALVSRVVVLGIIAMFYLLNLLTLLIFPGAVEKINDKVRAEFWISLAIGVAILIAIIPAIILFAISIVGILLIFLLPIALAVAGIFGFASISSVIGKRICESAKWKIENHIGVFSIGWLALMAIPILAALIHFPLIAVIGITIAWIAWTIGRGAAFYAVVKHDKKKETK